MEHNGTSKRRHCMVVHNYYPQREPRAALARNPGTPQVVVDYRELTTQPRATVHAIYRALDLPLSPAFDGWLSAQEAREKGHRREFRYSIDEYEVTPARIESELAGFYAQYDWPRHSAIPAAVHADHTDTGAKGASNG